MTKIFISYCSADEKIKDDIKNELKKNSEYQVIEMHDKNEPCYSNFLKWMDESIKSSDIFVIIMTKNNLEHISDKSDFEEEKRIHVKRTADELSIARTQNLELIPFVVWDKNELPVEYNGNLASTSIIRVNSLNTDEYKTGVETVINYVNNAAYAIKNHTNTNHTKIDNIPFAEVPNFVGREKELNQIDEAFRNSNYVILKGVGGIGKTALARHYFHSHGKEYDYKFIVNADKGIKDAIANIDFECTKAFKNDPEKRYQENIGFLKHLSKKCIFIFDNCDTDILQEEIEILKNDMFCRFAITSRNCDEFDNVIEVNRMDNQTIYHLADKICEKYKIDSDKRKEIISSNKSIDKLIEATGGHTLVVELALSVAFGNERSLDEVSKCLLTDTTKVRTQHGKNLGVPVNEQISRLYNFADLDKEERAVLVALCYVNPMVGIQKKQFRENVLKKIKALENINTDNIVNDLINKTFIRQNGVILSMHSLISNVIYNELRESDSDSIYAIIDYLSSDSIEDKNTLKDALSCYSLIMYVLENRNDHIAPDRIALLYHRLSLLAMHSGWTDRMLPLASKSLEIIEKAKPTNFATFKKSLINSTIATYYRDIQDFDNAEKYFNKSINGFEELYKKGEIYSHYGDTLGLLGGMYLMQKKYDKALQAYEKTILFYKHDIDKGDIILKTLIKFPEAMIVILKEHDFEKAFKIAEEMENLIKNNHNPTRTFSDLIYLLNYIGAIDSNLSKSPDNYIKCLEKAYEIDSKYFKDLHQKELKDILGTLERLYIYKKDNKNLKRILLNRIDLVDSTNEEERLLAISIYGLLSKVDAYLGQHDDADKHLKAAWDIMNSFDKVEHISTYAAIAFCSSDVYQAKREYEKALKYLNDAKEFLEKNNVLDSYYFKICDQIFKLNLLIGNY